MSQAEDPVQRSIENATDYIQAMCVVNHILAALSDPAELAQLMSVYFDMPGNLEMVAQEFDTIYQRWTDEEA